MANEINPLSLIGAFNPTQPDIQKLSEGLQKFQNAGTLQQIQDAAAGRRQAGVNEARIKSSLIGQLVNPDEPTGPQLNRLQQANIFGQHALGSLNLANVGIKTAAPSGTLMGEAIDPAIQKMMRAIPTGTSAARAGRVTTATDKDVFETTGPDPKTGVLGKRRKETTLQQKDKTAGQSAKDELLREELTSKAITELGLKASEFEIVVYPGTSRLVIRNTVTNKYYAKP
jgi:hypothetical protein